MTMKVKQQFCLQEPKVSIKYDISWILYQLFDYMKLWVDGVFFKEWDLIET